MSLKVKFKRAFSKARKFFIFSVIFVFIVCSFSISVSAEQKNVVVDVDVAKVQIKYTSGSSVSSTSWTTLSPVNLLSPNGGIFQGTKNSSGDIVSNALQWNINTYFTNLKFKKGTEYHLSGYYALPWGKLVTDDGFFNLYQIKLLLNDSNRNTRFEVDTSNASNISSWSRKNIKDGSNNADFGFYYFDIKFVPTSDFVGFFNTYITYNLVDPPNSGGYFGFSDLTLSYEYDPLTDPNYNSVDDGSVDEHNDLSDELESATAPGRDTAVQLMDVSNDGYTDIFKGLMVWSEFIDLSLSEVDWFDSLVDFSLSVGLYAFLLGLAIYAVGRLGSKSSSGGKSYSWGKKGGGE